MAPAVLPHRVLLDLDYSLRGTTAGEVIEAVLRAVDAPPVAADEEQAAKSAS